MLKALIALKVQLMVSKGSLNLGEKIMLVQRISYPEYNPEKIGHLLGAFGWTLYVVFA